jgi:uncharacterized protein (DUF1778 family)
MATAQLQYDNASSVRTSLETVSDAHTSANLLELPQTIRMSQRDFRLFLVALDSDEEPNDTLKAAAEKFKQKYR